MLLLLLIPAGLVRPFALAGYGVGTLGRIGPARADRRVWLRSAAAPGSHRRDPVRVGPAHRRPHGPGGGGRRCRFGPADALSDTGPVGAIVERRRLHRALRAPPVRLREQGRRKTHTAESVPGHVREPHAGGRTRPPWAAPVPPGGAAGPLGAVTARHHPSVPRRGHGRRGGRYAGRRPVGTWTPRARDRDRTAPADGGSVLPARGRRPRPPGRGDRRSEHAVRGAWPALLPWRAKPCSSITLGDCPDRSPTKSRLHSVEGHSGKTAPGPPSTHCPPGDASHQAGWRNAVGVPARRRGGADGAQPGVIHRSGPDDDHAQETTAVGVEDGTAHAPAPVSPASRSNQPVSQRAGSGACRSPSGAAQRTALETTRRTSGWW